MAVNYFLLVAYAIFWLLRLLLILSMWSRQRKIERELETIHRRDGENAEKT